MPRKPGLPVVMFKIEGLSDGREIRPATFPDDFSGQVLPVIQDARPARKLKSGNELTAERNVNKLERSQTVLRLSGIWASAPKLVELIPKGKRKIAMINGKAVLIDMPKWRRV
jgi:hypothetical protein